MYMCRITKVTTSNGTHTKNRTEPHNSQWNCTKVNGPARIDKNSSIGRGSIMLLPHVPVKRPLHLISFLTKPAFEFLFFGLLFPVRILRTLHEVSLQPSLVDIREVSTVLTSESLPLMAWLMCSELGLLQEHSATFGTILSNKGTHVLFCIRIVGFLMLFKGRTVPIVFETGRASVRGFLSSALS